MESLIEFYVHENMQLLDHLESILLGNAENELEKGHIEEIFRTMHTIKGSSSMMGYDSLTNLSHCIEDIFDDIRNGKKLSADQWEYTIDIVLLSIDFLKKEIMLIDQGLLPEESIDEIQEKILKIKDFDILANNDIANNDIEDKEYFDTEKNEDEKISSKLKKFNITVYFDDGCGMESIRAFGVLNSISDMCQINESIPDDLDSECGDQIINNGYKLSIETDESLEFLIEIIKGNMFIKNVITEEVLQENIKLESDVVKEELELVSEKDQEQSEIITSDSNTDEKNENIKDDINEVEKNEPINEQKSLRNTNKSSANSYLSVNINKVDQLMNLVGEIVTTESMVDKQSKESNFNYESFDKQARRLNQLTTELQDVVMSIRMVSISSVFTKMQRIVRDMSKKTGKKVELEISGENTEVDKNIIENISDPLMHMIRNSMDHGIESREDRLAKSKKEIGTIKLKAKNTGNDIVITIEDDGKGLDKESIVKKAIDKGMTNKSIEEISDKEAYSFILKPGFSTASSVTEYSGRGVGMDVVYTNISKLRGSISIDSEKGKGTKFTIRIPLTLSIVEGMKVKINEEIYIIPSLNIKEVFTQNSYKIAKNPNGTNYSIIRGCCYDVYNLSEILNIDTIDRDDNIMILLESELGSVCIMVDAILGQQQVVIKPMPIFLTKIKKLRDYIVGCSILEDGSISLILDINNIINNR